MVATIHTKTHPRPTGHSAFTLLEVVLAIVITGVVFVGILTGYVQSARRVEWSAYSLAAEALNIQQLEQLRSANWDTQTSSTNQDEFMSMVTSNWPYANGKWTATTTNVLDVPYNSANGKYVWATNYVSLSVIPVVIYPVVTVKQIQTDTVWTFRGKLFTNTIVAYRAPDQ